MPESESFTPPDKPNDQIAESIKRALFEVAELRDLEERLKNLSRRALKITPEGLPPAQS